MNISKLASTIAAVAGLSFLGSTIPAMATTNSTPAIPTPYVAAFTPAFGLTSMPYAGQMQLTISDGTVTGTYTGTLTTYGTATTTAITARAPPISFQCTPPCGNSSTS